MRTRRFLAAAVLAALPLVAGALNATPALHTVERPDGPRWLYALGFDWETAVAISQRITRCWACPETIAFAR